MKKTIKIISALISMAILFSLISIVSYAKTLSDFEDRVATFETEDYIREGSCVEFECTDDFVKIKTTENNKDGNFYIEFPETIGVSDCAYMVFKYKLSTDAKLENDWIYPNVGSGLLQSGLGSVKKFVGDGKWNLAIYKMPGDFSNANFSMPSDGELIDVRVGVPRKVNWELDIAWAGTFASEEDINVYDALFNEAHKLLDDGEQDVPEATQIPVVTDPTLPGCLIKFDSDVYESMFYETQYVSTPMYDSYDNCYIMDIPVSDDPAVKLSISDFVESGIIPSVLCENYPILQLVVQADATCGTKGNLYFTTEESKGFTEAKSVKFEYADTEDWQVININFGDNEQYNGTVGDLRIDPFNQCTSATQLKIKYMAFFTSIENANNYYEKEKNATPAQSPTEVVTEEPVVTPTEEPISETTEAPVTTDAPKDEQKKSGCGSIVMGFGAVSFCMIAAGLMLKRKEK